MTNLEMSHSMFIVMLFPMVFRAPSDPLWLLAIEFAVGLSVFTHARRLSASA